MHPYAISFYKYINNFLLYVHTEKGGSNHGKQASKVSLHLFSTGRKTNAALCFIQAALVIERLLGSKLLENKKKKLLFVQCNRSGLCACGNLIVGRVSVLDRRLCGGGFFIRYREKGTDTAWADVGSVKFQPGIFRDRGPDAAAAVVHGNRSGGDQCSCLDTSACAGEAAVSVQARQLQAAACGGDGVGGCGYLAQSCGSGGSGQIQTAGDRYIASFHMAAGIADDTRGNTHSCMTEYICPAGKSWNTDHLS